jgi:chromosome partitioning protein
VLAQQKGERVAIVDIDPQASAFGWYERRGKTSDKRIAHGGPYVMRALPGDLGKIISAAPTMGATLLIIDTAPATDDGALAAIRAANLIVVPTRPLPFEMHAVPVTANLLALAQRMNLALVVVNGVTPPPPPGTKTKASRTPAREYSDAVDELKRLCNLRPCTRFICNDEQITAAIGAGMGVTEYTIPKSKPTDAPKGNAAKQIIELWNELHLFVPDASNVVRLGAAR